MKKLLISLLFLLPISAFCETLPSMSCGSGETAFCQNPAPDIALITYNWVNGTVYAIVGGVQYLGTVPRFSTSFQVSVVNPTTGLTKLVTLSFTVLRHKAPGRNSIVTVWILDSGDVE